MKSKPPVTFDARDREHMRRFFNSAGSRISLIQRIVSGPGGVTGLGAWNEVIADAHRVQAETDLYVSRLRSGYARWRKRAEKR